MRATRRTRFARSGAVRTSRSRFPSPSLNTQRSLSHAERGGTRVPVSSQPMSALLIAGVPRSGTTWIGRALGHTENTAYVNEPDGFRDPLAFRTMLAYGENPVLEPGEPAPDMEALWTGALAGGRPAGTVRDRLARALYERTPLDAAARRAGAGPRLGESGTGRAPRRAPGRRTRRLGGGEVRAVGARAGVDRRPVPTPGARDRAQPVQRAVELDRARLRAEPSRDRGDLRRTRGSAGPSSRRPTGRRTSRSRRSCSAS